jgi:predicted HTH domain antitoxin
LFCSPLFKKAIFKNFHANQNDLFPLSYPKIHLKTSSQSLWKNFMEIAINLPNEFVFLQSIKDIEKDMRLSYALWLFKNVKVTLSKAAELATLDIYDFMAECKKNEVPVINVSREDLLDELASMNR